MSEKKKIPVILDGDPGHDDAIGWVLASTIPDFDIRAITTVAGNPPVEDTGNRRSMLVLTTSHDHSPLSP